MVIKCVNPLSPCSAAKPIRKSESEANQTEMARVTAIIAYSKGFACAAGPGKVLLYEKTEEKETYRKTREIRVTAAP